MKIHNHFSVTIISAILCVVMLLAPVEAGTYSGGMGDPNDPYQIADASDLLEMAGETGDWDRNFVLTGDIILDPNNDPAHVFTTAVVAPDANSLISYHQGTGFTGTFDGAGHIISNLTIDGGVNGDYLGLFGLIGSGGEVKNLGLVNVSVTGDDYLGGLCGCNYGDSISNCYASGSVTGGEHSAYLGGLCGRNYYGSISNCYANSPVTGRSSLGGLCGRDYRGTISDCYATGSVIGSSNLGGLCGSKEYGSITNCYATGSVSSGDNSTNIGGLCGYNKRNTISNCHASGSVSGGDGSYELGGLFGDSTAYMTSNCYATGSVTGGDGSYDLGGLCGSYAKYEITDCYATGSVTGGADSYNLGGLYGSGSGNISNCYATGSVSGDDYLGGLCGFHRSRTISNCSASGSVSGDDYLGGLCGWNDRGTIINCSASGSVSGDRMLGGLCGYNRNTVGNSCASGSVSGGDNSYRIGGLCGENDSGMISNCYANGSVSGGDSSHGIGGLCGENRQGSTSNCYASGSVTGGEYSYRLGGLCGNAYGLFTACFWDIETSGMSESIGGIGKTTAEMQTANTFIDAGWAFVEETTNGTEDIWTIREGFDYPRLWWQLLENTAPVADAGGDITAYAWVDGFAVVGPNGFGSFDADGDELSYRWSWEIGGAVFDANGVAPLISLPVGEHFLELVVYDGSAYSEPNSVLVTVVGALEVKAIVVPRVLSGGRGRRSVFAIVSLPDGVVAGDVADGSFVLYVGGTGGGSISADSQRVISGDNGGRVFASFDREALLALAGEASSVQVVIAGELATGQYITGADTVRLVRPQRRSSRGGAAATRGKSAGRAKRRPVR